MRMTDPIETQASAETLQIIGVEDRCPIWLAAPEKPQLQEKVDGSPTVNAYCLLKDDPIKNSQAGEVEYYMILDLEAVCDEKDGKKVKYDPRKDNPQEVIKFTMVIYPVAEGQITEIFHQLVRPKINRELTPFCMKLTESLRRWLTKQIIWNK